MKSAQVLWVYLWLIVDVAHAGLDITTSPTPLAPPRDHPSILVHHATEDKGGNTSLRFMANRKVDENKYPTNGVTAFAKAAREQPQRDRDLGQTFPTGDKGGKLNALFLRVGHADLAMLTNTPGARVAVQWFEVTGEPRLNDHGTPGFSRKFDRVSSPELDDYLEGETYKPLRVVEGRLPASLKKSDYLKLDFTGDDEFVLKPSRTYAFLLMFLDRAPLRGMTLANEYYGTYTPDPANNFRGHGIRREGLPAFPDDWKARLNQPPGTLGFPDVCTFRDLHFAVTVKGVETSVPAYEKREVEGWRVFVQRALLASEPALTARALELLKIQLAEINRVVPAPAAKSLRAVPLHFSPEYPGFKPTAEFHPAAGWLRANGRDPAMARGVEFSNVRQFAAEMDRMPNFTLHELAHAYHHRVLADGFANREIQAAYERAKAGGRYDRVERWFGTGKSNTFERAYAMNNPMEYFAETTEAFFSRNDFFPFTRDELRAHDPEMFTLLAKLWGAPERMGSATSPPRKTAAAFMQAPVLFHTPEADAICSALEVFPPDNPWNQFVDKWPRHPHSDAIIASIGRDKPFRCNLDMGFVLVPPDQPRVPVKIVEYPGESDPGPFPVPENIPIEGWPAWHQRENAKPPTLAEVQRRPANYEGDRHAIVVDPVNRMLYEFFTFGKTADGWAAGQASVFDLKSNTLRPTGWTSTDAAGLPIFPAVVRYDEIQRGQVEHALRVTVTKTRREFVSPATHFASRHDNADYPRMGERIRLKQDFDISGFSPTVQAILKGLKRYGMFVADNGIDWAISVAPDPRLPVLHEELRKIKGADFEAVIAPE